MRCQDIMKDKVHCLSPADTAQAAARTMRDLNVGFLPVCGPNMNVIGTITDRDLAVRLLAEGRPASTPVSAVMSQDVVSCQPDDEIEQAERLMAEHHKSRIIVMDGGSRAVGVISLSDIAQNLDPSRAGQTMKQVAEREARAL
jgi:CBS domain-containing protein